MTISGDDLMTERRYFCSFGEALGVVVVVVVGLVLSSLDHHQSQSQEQQYHLRYLVLHPLSLLPPPIIRENGAGSKHKQHAPPQTELIEIILPIEEG